MGTEYPVDGTKREIKILEVKQNSQVAGHGKDKKNFSYGFMLNAFMYKHAKRIVYCYRQKHDQDIPGFAPGVKKQTGKH